MFIVRKLRTVVGFNEMLV